MNDHRTKQTTTDKIFLTVSFVFSFLLAIAFFSFLSSR